MIGSTFRRINVEQIKELFLPAPAAQEQASISSFLDSICNKYLEQSKCAVNCMALLRERRSALISAAVTGQIDVRGYSSEAALA